MSVVSDVTSVLLDEAWAALGGERDLLELVTVTGDGEGLLASRLPALPAMAAAVAASTLAASVLDAARRARSPAPVVLDVEHVALAACSERHARDGASEASNLFAALSRFWRTADGWLRLHTNYAWHRERALGVLSCEESPETVAEAVLGWRGEELEDALAGAGALGYVVRSAGEWQVHPQGQAVASLPLLDSVPGRGVGRTIGAGRAAEGRRVLDLTRVIAGPVATRTLAAWGAGVLRVDSPCLPEIPAQALDMLPGKRSALLDFAEPPGRAALERLLAEADLVVQGYRPGALARFGLSTDALAERHPHLSVVTLSAWGPSGPWAARRGFDSLVQCPTGIAVAEGTDGRPGALPAQVLDHATGYLAAAAALLALADEGFSTAAEAFELARSAIDAGDSEDGLGPLSIVGDFVLPPVDGPETRNFQTLHFDFGLPLDPKVDRDVARYTALHVPDGAPRVSAVTRLVPLGALLRQRTWPARPELLGSLLAYGRRHGAWDDNQGYVEGSLARIVEAAAGSEPDLPSVKQDRDFLCGLEFDSLRAEVAFFARHGLRVEDVAIDIALRPGGLLVFDNFAVAHGRRGTRAPGELCQRVFGHSGLAPAAQCKLRARVLSAFYAADFTFN